ncbi:MAG: hypothetical protein M1419_00805 [Bacteroidetes bacterium]|nr:hypothetical protein [Bacteroidota bacterium]
MNQELLKFLKKTKFAKEFELFLEQYQKTESGKFAIIKISGSTLENHIDSISEDIGFLNKFKLYPIVVHGAGAALDKAVSGTKINGIRYTSSDDIKKVRVITNELTARLIHKIKLKGGNAENMSNCLECDFLDKELYGNVGKIINVNAEKILNAIREGKTPVFSNVVSDKNGNPFNINADSVAQSLFNHFIPKRLFFITETGGVLDSENKIIQHINLSDFTDAYGGMLFKLKSIKSIMLAHPNSAVVITSAPNLIKEIFTIKGSGTFISNFQINKFESKENVDFAKLADMLNSAFNKKLNSNYFDKNIKAFYIHNDYKAVAIIKDIDKIDYLCKFAVMPSHQGTGLAKYIWDILNKDYKTLIWRSRSTNLANNFYNSRCTGMVKSEGWHIYWYGRKYMPIEFIEKITNIEESFITGS